MWVRGRTKTKAAGRRPGHVQALSCKHQLLAVPQAPVQTVQLMHVQGTTCTLPTSLGDTQQTPASPTCPNALHVTDAHDVQKTVGLAQQVGATRVARQGIIFKPIQRGFEFSLQLLQRGCWGCIGVWGAAADAAAASHVSKPGG